jgi:hypothetical protein
VDVTAPAVGPTWHVWGRKCLNTIVAAGYNRSKHSFSQLKPRRWGVNGTYQRPTLAHGGIVAFTGVLYIL